MPLIPPSFAMPDFALVAPEIWMLAMICVVLVADLFVPGKDRLVTYWLSQLTLVGAAWITLETQWGVEALTFTGSYIGDSLAAILKVSIFVITFIGFAYAWHYFRQRDLLKGEFFTLSLISVLGMMVIASAHSLLTVYLGLELMSLALYALVAIDRDSKPAAEGAMKYFVLGALASGLTLYGMSMVYGATASLDLGEIAAIAAAGTGGTLMGYGLTFLVVGVAFKFGAVPFHMWIPDVYQGAPTPITLFIGTASKIAAVAMFVRLIGEGLGALHEQWQLMVTVLAVVSLVVGNLFALVQTNFKRLLGYSTISHVGFIFLGFIAGTGEGAAASLFYIIAYALTAAVAFGIVILLGRKGFEADEMDDLRGLFKRDRWSAIALLLTMFSMAGVPGTVGFYAKLLVIKSVIDVGMISLAVFAMVFAVVAAYYYLRVLKLAFFDEPAETVALEGGKGFRLLLQGNGLALLVLGIFPGALMAACLAAFA